MRVDYRVQFPHGFAALVKLEEGAGREPARAIAAGARPRPRVADQRLCLLPGDAHS